MKFIFFIAFLATIGTAQATTTNEVAGLKWYTDLEKAHSEAEKTDKPIFGFFTGSDWCGWCIKLQKEVFAKQAFIDWAKEKVVLLELDFPKRTAQSPELKQQNQNLQKALGVAGYPTVWLFTSKKTTTGGFNLTRVGKLGYPRGAVKGKEEVKFLSDANKLLGTMTK
ncbi:MAG: thioredoxin family protein [Flavobacteriaceae bacterium]|nr:thioredoxin family protein [Flavobacteriaceae bacterium]